MKYFLLKTSFVFLGALFFVSSVSIQSVYSYDSGSKQELGDAEPRSWGFRDAGMIPVQNGGRIKPLDTYAREIATFVTGRQKYSGWDPVDLIFSWISNPMIWKTKPIIRVDRKDLKRQLLVDENQKFFSRDELIGNPVFLQYARGAAGGDSQQTKLPIDQAGQERGLNKESQRDKELKKLFNRVSLFDKVVSGSAITLLPTQDISQPWNGLTYRLKEESFAIREHFAEMVRAYVANDEEKFNTEAQKTAAEIKKAAPQWRAHDDSVLKAEFFYNRTQPFMYAWILYLLAAIYWFGLMIRCSLGRKKGTQNDNPFLESGFNAGLAGKVGLGLTAIPFILHTVGFALRCFIAGRPPVTNMYESVIWVAFGILIFAYVIYWFNRQLIVFPAATFLAGLTLIAADFSPVIMSPNIDPLVPVLRSNLWLTVHVLTITISYAAFALCLGLGNMALFQYIKGKPSTTKVSNINQISYRSMQFGVVLLAAGTILGGVWADYSWGRFWGWDPKEVWALIALLVYLAILHGRFAGWVSQFGFAAWTVLGFMSVVMAWYGVNFVLGVGLHSYGFSSGGGSVVGISCGIQGAFVLLAVWARRKRKAASE